MSREYRHHHVNELQDLVRTHPGNTPMLRMILDELQHRRVPTARQLRREIEGLLRGEVPKGREQDDQENLGL